MTLPASFPLSMSQIATELGLALPLSINHGWVLALAQKALPVSFSDLLGKTGRFDGSLAASGSPIVGLTFPNSPFFGGQLGGMTQDQFGNLTLSFASAPNWSLNIKVSNNTDSQSATLTKSDSVTWRGNNGLLLRSGFTDSFTILPSN
jgi:hypothetical protein